MYEIYTHNQIFHIDEIMSIVLLKKFFFNGRNFSIYRTRDMKILSEKLNHKETFVIDVGFIFNENMLNFDHHQSDASLVWTDGTPYSSCGLIWRWLKKKNLINLKEEIIVEIEDNLIKRIDKCDNGIQSLDIGNIIANYYRRGSSQEEQMEQFLKAMHMLEDYFDNLLYKIRSLSSARKKMSIYIKNSEKLDDIIVCDTNEENAPVIASSLTSKKIIIYPRNKNTWILQAIPLYPENEFSSRILMPEKWRGLQYEELSEISMVDNMVFCHKNGFLCIIEGDKEDAIYLGEKIIKLEN